MSLGKTDPSLIKMSKDEIKTIHETHKRETHKADKGMLRKEEFEINQEDDDDDFAGPKMELFQKDQGE